MKKLLWTCCAVIFLGACVKKASLITENEPIIAKKEAPAGVKADDWVWTSNQGSGQIEIYDPAVENWSTDPNALKFFFKPLTANGYLAAAVTNWDVPNDFKVRNNTYWGGNTLVACASKGLVTIATYPLKIKKWAVAVGTTVHPHGVELLPSGHVAVACTDQNLVKVYMAAKPGVTDNSVFASFPTNKPHSVFWDPTTQTIRAIGNDHILSLVLSGTVDAPVLQEVGNNDSKRIKLIDGGTVYGHDISPDLNDTNIIWCSTNGGVYKADKTTKTLTGAPSGVNKTFVKAISRQNSGIFVLTRPDSKKTTVLPDPVTDVNWLWDTRYVDFYSSTGTFMYYRYKQAAMFYRAKIFRTPY